MGINPQKNLQHASVDANEGGMLLTKLHCPMGCHRHHTILCNSNRFLSETLSFWHLVVPLNNFASMSDCPWVQGKSNKPQPLPRYVCGVGNNYSMILPHVSVKLIFMNMQMR